MNQQTAQQRYPHLFQKLQVKNFVFKNRILAAPTHHSFAADPQDNLSERGALIYAERARGGAASVTIGEGKMDLLNSTGHTGHINCFDEVAAQRLMWYADLVHTYGAAASIEFNHAGQFADPRFNPAGMGPMGASACVMPNGLECREMTEEDMDRVANNYAQACRTAKDAGLDMVNLHFGHGWLVGGFLSPMFNHRTDAYGGSVENRCRFPKMILQRVRQAVGEDFIIEIRVSGDELVPDGLKIDEVIEILRHLVEYVDMIQISCGTRLDPVSRCHIGADHFTRPCHNAVLSEAVKKAGFDVPIGVVGNITQAADAEAILAKGQADYVVMARSFIADPQWGVKVRDGEEEDIRPCIKCSRCGNMHKSICSVNPTFGYASLRESVPASGRSKKVVVIGGGVAGLQAAIEAADRGHDCVLLEARNRLGGQLFYTDYVWFKADMRRYRDYLIRQVSKRNVEVRLNTRATPELVAGFQPDAIIVAVGAQPAIPPIPGVELPNVRSGLDAFGRENELGERVVIIGGGMVGCELSLHLAHKGVKDITVIEMGAALAPDAVMLERTHTLHLMDVDEAISSHTGLRCTAITAQGVIAVDSQGQEHFFPADTVLLASGMRGCAEERDSFEGLARQVVAVGDCVKVSNVHNAVSTGYSAALSL